MLDKNAFGAEFIDYSYAGTVWGRLFDEKGNLVYEGNIKFRKAYGYGTSYFPNGTKYQEGIFNVKGLVSGKEFYPNGQLRFEGTYEINNAYGPNYPIFGDFYLPDGTKVYSGKFEVVREGLGWPIVIEPREYGKIVQEGHPDIPYLMWNDLKYNW